MVYISADNWEELYDFRKRELKELEKTQRIPIERGEEGIRVVEREKIVPRIQAMPFIEEDEIEPIRRSAPKIIGSLFDRIDFLKERIHEIKEIMKMREKLHREIISEIETDIKEKMEMESHIADFDERRNIMLDISVLRKEKRKENMQFWRDMTELRSELKQLLEEYRVESKISEIFKELKGENNE